MKIKVLRTDRGGEFMSREFAAYCDEAGITRHFTAPYSPQQNGVVERRNRTVVAMARSLLKGRKLLSYFWGEAVRHSTYLLNRLPTRAVSGITPYEAWKEKKPDVTHVRVFGCVAYMKLPSVHTTKLDDRSKKMVHLGNEPGTKAYRLLDPMTGKISVSRDVIFEEHKAWEWNEMQQQEMSANQDMFTIRDTHSVMENEDVTEVEPVTPGGYNSGEPYSPDTTPESGEGRSIQSDMYDGSTEPRRFRSLGDVYAETEQMILEDELLFVGIDEPTNFKQAAMEPAWKQAMEAEIEAIKKTNTWQLTELPPGHKAVGLKWVFKLKRDENGEVVKHKARLVAKGYVQKQGIDFDEVFAPVTQLETVRLLLALAAKHGWEVHHLDVKSAFSSGELQETVFVSHPEGFIKEGKEHLVYRLIKALYGLRQAPRAWYARLNKYLLSLGFSKCPYEHAVYIKREGDEALVIGVYVDDLLITGTTVSSIKKFKKQMGDEFEMSDLGKLSYYLGIEVSQLEGKIELKQMAYAKKLLERAGMADCRSVKYPMETKIQIDKDEKGKAVNPTQFKSVIGGLRYLVHTRPDIAYAVGIVSRYMERPTALHQMAVKANSEIHKRDIGLWVDLFERGWQLHLVWFFGQRFSWEHRGSKEYRRNGILFR